MEIEFEDFRDLNVEFCAVKKDGTEVRFTMSIQELLDRNKEGRPWYVSFAEYKVQDSKKLKLNLL